MSTSQSFKGTIPATYHELLGPLIFADYARNIAARVKPQPGSRILELAAGTGIVTKELVRVLPNDGELVVTDLNDAMLDIARPFVGPDPRLTFKAADACELPFEDDSFDAIVCQFGVMFFPDKLRAMREARRVLVPGGKYIFNVWDSLEHNPLPRTAHETLLAHTPDNPVTFLAKTPYGYSDVAEIERVCRAAGFTVFAAETIQLPSVAPSADHAARGFIEGTPVLAQLAERGVTDTTKLRAAAAWAFSEKFGDKPCRATMQAIVVTVG